MRKTYREIINDLLNLPSGEVIDEENHVQAAIVSNLVQIVREKTTQLEKTVFYFQDEDKWSKVAEKSAQSCESKTTGEISKTIETGCTVIEFGPGDFIKTKEAFNENITTYFAVDCNKRFLDDKIRELAKLYPCTRVIGICTTFDRALSLFTDLYRHPDCKLDRTKTQLWSLGSTLSNYNPERVIRNLKRCRRFASMLWLGQDATSDEKSIEDAYHSTEFNGLIQNGRERADNIWKKVSPNIMTLMPFFSNKYWRLHCDLNLDPDHPNHTILMTMTRCFGGIKRDTTIHVFSCMKYSESKFVEICEKSGWTVENSFMVNPPSDGSQCSSGIYLLTM